MSNFFTGIGLIVLIAALAGGIAYVGDRVGHQVGRKRLTLFGIRPRYTSTIVAIGTGVVIALIVTLGAIFASNEVKTAFFTLRTVNDQITSLRVQASALETKVNDTQIVVPLDQPVSVNVARLPKGSSLDQREKIVRDFYASTVAVVNTSYPRLKPFQPPGNVGDLLKLLAQKADVTNDDWLVIAVADRNLFVDDHIHFGLQAYQDSIKVKSGELLASMSIPAGPSANVGLAIQQLLQHVVEVLTTQKKLSPLFIGTPQVTRTIPSVDEMQKMLSTGKGSFVMAAFAQADIYPHTALQTGSLPIVVVLTPSL